MEQFEDDILQFGAGKAVQARPAREDDNPADVLTVGEEFHYLAVDSDADGKFVKAMPPSGWPSRIVFDADSFLSGLAPTGMAMLAVRESDGYLFKVGIDSLA